MMPPRVENGRLYDRQGHEVLIFGHQHVLRRWRRFRWYNPRTWRKIKRTYVTGSLKSYEEYRGTS